MERIRYGRSGLIGLFLKLLVFLLMCAWASRSLEARVMAPGNKPQAASTTREKIKQIYASQLGVREKGHNSGKAVEAYLHYVGLPKGNPWCAAFVCWVYGQAGVQNPRSGWSPSLFPGQLVIWSDQGAKSEKEHPPAAADVFGIYFPEKGRIAHVGFVDEWKGDWLITVEGNTNELGGREGDGVYRKRRSKRTITKVARYVRDR